MFSFLSTFIPRAIVQGIPLIFGCTGEILTEKSGNLNLGIPGVMYVGGICGVIGAFFYEQAAAASGQFSNVLALLIPLLCCLLGSLLMGLLYCFLTVTLRSNQNVTGLAMTTFGVGFGNFFGGSLIKLSNSSMTSVVLSRTSLVYKTSLPFASSLGWFGNMFLSYSFLAYVAVLLALISSYVLKKTRTGLQLRAVGESPATADAAGINITRYKYAATCIGCMIAGIWRPGTGIWSSFLFGGLYILYLYLPTTMEHMELKELYKMIPYVMTVVVLILTSMRNRRENQPPASLGLAYFREER